MFSKNIDSHKDDIIKTLCDFVKIKSVESEGSSDKPFGPEVDEALRFILKKSESLGFRVKNLDGYVGYAEYGDGEETVGILVHVDVVPAGDGWSYPPFEAHMDNGKIFGRGTLDDKGPTVAALYALNAIKESGIPLKKKVRIIFGADEETNCVGMNYYLDRELPPCCGFTPDANFPVINGEKGILSLRLGKRVKHDKDGEAFIKRIEGGTAINVVPDYCFAEIMADKSRKEAIIKELEQYNEEYGNSLKYELGEGCIKIESIGRSAHASTPEEGKNAISILLDFLEKLNFEWDDVLGFIREYNKYIGMEYNGQSLGCGLEDEMSGKLTLNVGLISCEKEKMDIRVDIRYPITCDWEVIVNSIKEKLSHSGIEVAVEGHEKPIYFPEDHPMVSKLIEVYRRHTGDIESKPLVIGGGTYARFMDNIIAFGPVFPGEEELAHQKDEYISIDNLIKIADIYADAIYELAK